MIRQATLADFDRGYAICKRAYPDRPVYMGIPWVMMCLQRPHDHHILISDHGVSFASMTYKYGFIPVGCLDILAVEPGHPWEALKHLRAMIEWSKLKGAKRFNLGSDTGVDLGPLAIRLGGKRADASYCISF